MTNAEVGFTIVTLIALLLPVALTWGARRSDYVGFSASPNWAGTVRVAASCVGTIVGGGMFFATTQIAFEAGIFIVAVGLVYAAGLAIMGIYAPAIRALVNLHDAATLSELIRKTVGARSALVFSLVGGGIFLFLLAGQVVAIQEVFPTITAAIGNSFLPILFLALAGTVALLYPLLGGIRKDVSADFVQMVIVSLALLVLVWHAFGATGGKFDDVPTEVLMGRAYGPLTLVGLVLFYTPTFLVRQDFWQRIIMARSDGVARQGFFIAAGVSALAFAGFGFIGLAARQVGLESAAQAIGFFSPTSTLVKGLVIGGVFAAVASTADTLMNNLGIFGEQAFRRRNGTAISERTQLFTARLWGIVAFLVAVALAFIVRDLVDLMIGSLSLLLVFLPFVFEIFARSRVSDTQLAITAGVSLAVFLFFFFALEWTKVAFAPAVATTFLMYSTFRWRARPR